MNEAATSPQSRAEMGKWVWRRRGSLSQTEPQTCAHRDVKRLVQRNLPSRSAGGKDTSPAQPCSLQGTKPDSPSCLFQIRVLTSGRPQPGQAGLTAGSILQVRSLRVSGKERRLPYTKTSLCPLLPASPEPEGEGQVIHTFSQHPAPCPPSGPWMGKPQTLL